MESIKNQKNKMYIEGRQYARQSLKNKGWHNDQLKEGIIKIESIILNTKRYVVEHKKREKY